MGDTSGLPNSLGSQFASNRVSKIPGDSLVSFAKYGVPAEKLFAVLHAILEGLGFLWQETTRGALLVADPPFHRCVLRPVDCTFDRFG